MKKFLNNIKAQASHIRMSNAEKAAMKANIFGLPAQAGVVSPVPATASPYFFFSYQFRMSMAGLLLFIVAGSGTVSAAQNALPGDILYPIKLSINEKAEVALAPTSEAKAEVQARQAERRVDEAQALAVQGRLDEKTAQTLTADFDEHAAEALALAGPDKDEPAAGDAPVQAAMTMTLSAVAPEVKQATTTFEQDKQSTKKSFGPRESLRASLKIKAELLKEIKIRSQKQELRNVNEKDEGGTNAELQINR